jgi:two-component system, OmpR family, sensor kinase
MTIKARLALAFVALLLGATVVVGFVVVRATKSSLVEQIDNRLRETDRRRPEDQGLPGRGGGEEGESQFEASSELILSADGELVDEAQPAGFTDDPLSLPDVSGVDLDASVDRIITVPSEDGAFDYHVLVRNTPEGDYHVFAAPLIDVDETVSDLIRTLALAATGTLLLGAGVAWWIVRRGLKPVDGMIDTASAIAGGDLSQRVDHREDGTELGRLATALDDMLAQLEMGFGEREASKARLEQFVADASHELRTPVTAIRGYAELYRNGGLQSDDELERAMTRIEGESTRMGRLVDDLLLLARMDEQQPLELADVDLTDIAADAVADARAVDAARPVTLEAPGPVVVRGDDRRLRQVVANLLNNARVHTPERTPVHVVVSSNGENAVLVVRDEGPGITDEDRRRIFERFYRADPSRSRAKGGSGLGLSIVAAVVQAHGGTVSVASAAGQGASFTVQLPQSTPTRARTPS